MTTEVNGGASLAAAEQRLRALDLAPSVSRDELSSSTSPPRTPVVGVIVPTYRDSAFLPMALESVRRQTYPYWQCVIVDDGSPENVESAVAPFVEREPRFQLLRHGVNEGLPAARNTALGLLDSELVLFLDADDMLVPDALRGAVAMWRAHSDQPAVVGVHGHVEPVPEETTVEELSTWTGRFPRHTVDWPNYTGDCPFNVHSPVLRRSVIAAFGGFDVAYRNGAADWELWFRLLRHGYRFEPNPHLMGAYRQRRASMFRSAASDHVARSAQLFDAAERTARLDPALVVGLGGGVPLSRARLGLARARRAAARIALEVGASVSLHPIDTSDAYGLLDLGALTEGTQRDVFQSAKNGLARGLGISRPLVAELSAESQRRLDQIAALVATSIFERDARARAMNRGDASTVPGRSTPARYRWVMKRVGGRPHGQGS